MLRSAYKQLAVFALLGGLVLRALTPLGYMPATAGSGLLFELCPDQLPAGFMAQNADASSHHHHGNSDDTQPAAEADQCQIGHLLFSAVAADPAVDNFNSAPTAADFSVLAIQTFSCLTLSVYQSRAPPHLSSKQFTI